MATAAQILANRENARHSTGPKTEEGKAKSSVNNLQHGLAARGFIVLPGQESAFANLEEGLRINLTPNGQLQETIFLRLLESAWNLHRCRLASAQLHTSSTNPAIDPLIDDQLQAKHARIEKYAKQSETSLRKSFEDLGRIQTELQYRHEAYPITEEQRDDDELLNQTPHTLSSACHFAEVMETVTRQEKRTKPSNAGRRKAAQAQFKVALDRFITPPQLPTTNKFQFEANPRKDAA